jgi:acyl dehydratase
MTAGQIGTVHYLDDIEAGLVFETPARTITEADVVAFAGLSGDYNPIHTDVEFASTTAYGQRVVYGLLTLSIVSGLLDRSRIFSGSAVAMLGISDWAFRAPVFIGDTVRVRLTIESVRRTRSNPERGVVHRLFQVLNQRDEIVQEGHIDVLVRSKEKQP